MEIQRSWLCQIRPGNSYNGGRLGPKDFYRPTKVNYIIIEDGILIQMYSPQSRTLILKNKAFSVVRKSFNPNSKIYYNPITGVTKILYSHNPNIHCVCCVGAEEGREVLFTSPYGL